jgi:hypothetical protein
MTRHGSLAYYLAAWVCGCFFMTLAAWLVTDWTHDPNTKGLGSASGFLVLYFFGLIFGAFPSVLFAWLLRRIVAVLRAEQVWVWVVLGAALAYPLLWSLGWVGRLPQGPGRPDSFIWVLLFGGFRGWPSRVFVAAIPAAAATSATLFYIHRAFKKVPAVS